MSRRVNYREDDEESDVERQHAKRRKHHQQQGDSLARMSRLLKPRGIVEEGGEIGELRAKYEALLALRYTEAERNLQELIKSSEVTLKMEREQRRLLQQELEAAKSVIAQPPPEDDNTLRDENQKLERVSDLLKVYAELTGLRVHLPNSGSLEKGRVPAVIQCTCITTIPLQRAAKFNLHWEQKQNESKYRFVPAGDPIFLPEDLRSSESIFSKEEIPLIVSKITQHLNSLS